MTMTRTILSMRFVFILATVIGIHGQSTPREATLAVLSNYEDGLSDSEFRVDFPGVEGSSSATIKIFRKDDGENGRPKIEYTIKKGAEEAQTLYFELKKENAPEGIYQVQVCVDGGCSAKRSALGKVLDEQNKPLLSCNKGTGPEENIFYGFENDPQARDFKVKIIPGSSFMTPEELAELPSPIRENSGYTTLELSSNPAYIRKDGKDIFYVAVAYNGTHLKDFMDTAVDAEQKQILESKYPVTRKLFNEEHTHGYCSRKYIFWATAHVVTQDTKLVVRRYRGTIMPSEASVNQFILNLKAIPIPLELVKYDDTKLETGIYDVSVSFCASEKDVINSSVCSKAIHSVLKVE